MLAAKLLAVKPAGNLEFVGGRAATSTGQTPSYSLTGLTGGLASSPSIGDIVVVAVGFSDGTDRDITCTTAGYTELADLKSGTFAATQMGVFLKKLTLADTSVAFDLGVSANSACAIHVWRNASDTQPDSTTTTTTNSAASSLSIDAPAITTSTSNAVVLAFAFANSNDIAISSYSTPSGMSNLFQVATGNARIGVASAVVTSPSSYNPPTFGTRGGGGGSFLVTTFCAATAAIRPA